MDAQKKLSLAARYRPQKFADVAGQEMVKAVLSKASLEDRPACAYLFSGTRGVGKTTIARIFAKALNCAHAPCAEPCNECEQCRKIMQGGHVDVVEIDGASNNKVDDVRALRETVGYSAMEGRYKIFIIDEAHMLTTPAFNALLKTLEEPPPHVVFMMATTEVHKFPITIVSRCQHFTFRHLNEEEIVDHLHKVLQNENLPFEEDAVRLIAKRAQGSVRDSMSLLDQTLAFGGEGLTVQVTREVLGLAGQEFFEQLFDAIYNQDATSVIQLSRGILRRGVDIGFLLTELAGHLRTLFLTTQAGQGIWSVLQLTPDETKLATKEIKRFGPAHLHAAWQLVLDAQRSVVQSTEPASALELLLLNLALLPKLLPLDNVSEWQAATGISGSGSGQNNQGSIPGAGGGQPNPTPTPNYATQESHQASQISQNVSSNLRPATGQDANQAQAKAYEHSPTQDLGHVQTSQQTQACAQAQTQPQGQGQVQAHTQTQSTQQSQDQAPKLPETQSQASTQDQAQSLKPVETPDPTQAESQTSIQAQAQDLKPAECNLTNASQAGAYSNASLANTHAVAASQDEPASKPQTPSSTFDSSYTLDDGSDDDLDENADENLEELGGANIDINTFDARLFWQFSASWCQDHPEANLQPRLLGAVTMTRFGNKFLIAPTSSRGYEQVLQQKNPLSMCLAAYLKVAKTEVDVVKPKETRPEDVLKKLAYDREELQPCFRILGAQVIKCDDLCNRSTSFY
ncbi:MAG: DNA polymerase III subunit gamma/tau [Desulfovibrionaceae bacterium]|nr:DNA polymerase III subunit gamma/tau [Desulfovibrionaceae bacterium]